MGVSALNFLCLALSVLSSEQVGAKAEAHIEPPILESVLDLKVPPYSSPSSTTLALTLTIDIVGRVSEVHALRLTGDEYDWLLARLLELRFQPARYGTTPVAVRVPLELNLEIPPVPSAKVQWQVFEEGTRQALSGVLIRILSEDREIASVITDEVGQGAVELRQFEDLVVIAEGQGYLSLLTSFEAAADQVLDFDILLMPESAFGGYRQVVRAKRQETGSRLVLTQKELTHVAGALNDPFRTIQTLPGVSNISSLFPLPVVRGTGPNHSSVWIDGFMAPMVFHFLAGPSVIYPELLKELSYESGDAGAEFGGQIGGVISARTGFDLSSEADTAEANLNLAQAGLLGRKANDDDKWIASARIGYPGYLLRLGGAELDLTYWDYHGQWSRIEKTKRERVALYGAGDVFGTPTSVAPLRLQFHRLLYEYRAKGLRIATMTEMSATTLPDQPEELMTTSAGLNLGYGWSLLEDIQVDIGVQSKLSYDDVNVNQAVVDSIAEEFEEPGIGQGGEFDEDSPTSLPEEDFLKDAEAWRGLHSAHLSLAWRVPSLGLNLAPGIRYDFIHQKDNTLSAWDARFRLRQTLSESDELKAYLKASTGLFSQPPRVPLIIPGLDFGLLNLGMQRSWQSSLGVEVKRDDWTMSVTGFYSKMTNLSLDWGMVDESGEIPIAVEGRAYGVELFIRRARARGLFGWLAYTWSRSTRNWGTGWHWFTLDREHVGNLVVGFELERGWGISGRVLYQSGVPQEPELHSLVGTPRGASFLRFDIRFDRRVIYPSWALEYYVDIGNALVEPESFGPADDDAAGYVVPMLGMRARF